MVENILLTVWEKTGIPSAYINIKHSRYLLTVNAETSTNTIQSPIEYQKKPRKILLFLSFFFFPFLFSLIEAAFHFRIESKLKEGENAGEELRGQECSAFERTVLFRGDSIQFTVRTVSCISKMERFKSSTEWHSTMLMAEEVKI
ncbi:hypothetical protein CEXT_471951 [Caerostris extrusa]|uniref:Uncharacterized protein n=1 Tax=Caerostris extrusa TaxID=172846 RepID=A0AAV4MZ32_CAEEX|nr:hypothetical protein CEXT_471951 [Caerostris extrusa]